MCRYTLLPMAHVVLLVSVYIHGDKSNSVGHKWGKEGWDIDIDDWNMYIRPLL